MKITLREEWKKPGKPYEEYTPEEWAEVWREGKEFARRLNETFAKDIVKSYHVDQHYPYAVPECFKGYALLDFTLTVEE